VRRRPGPETDGSPNTSASCDGTGSPIGSDALTATMADMLAALLAVSQGHIGGSPSVA
jgi:hypothetical protein